jgi:hypothetical protein
MILSNEEWELIVVAMTRVLLDAILERWRSGYGVKVYQATKDTDVVLETVPLSEDYISGKN